MTLLHQAAQKAVEAMHGLREAVDAAGYCTRVTAQASARADVAIADLESAIEQQEVPSGETEAQRVEVCKAWAALPDDLRKDPRMKRLYLALGGLRMDAPVEVVQEVPRG